MNTVQDFVQVLEQVKGKSAEEAKRILDNDKVGKTMKKVFMKEGKTASIVMSEDTIYIFVDSQNIVRRIVQPEPGVTIWHGGIVMIP